MNYRQNISRKNSSKFKTPAMGMIQAMADSDYGYSWSKHARQRMDERNISITHQEEKRIGDCIQRMEAKGAKESLLLTGDTAYIVSVVQRKIITFIARDNLKGNLFTKIDSVMLV